MKRMNSREKRRYRIRKRIIGTTERPRLAVFRSNKFIYAQIIDDSRGVTLAAVSDAKIEDKSTKIERAFKMGQTLAAQAVKIGITSVVFDRGGFLYHGRVKRLAEGARDGGLQF